jgi:hypothetical protein
MKMLLPVALLSLIATLPSGAKILTLGSHPGAAEVLADSNREVSSTKSFSGYQSWDFENFKKWVTSEDVDTFGPLTLGLLLLALPIRFGQGTNSTGGLRAGEDSNLRRIGQSWDPRF